MYVSFVDVRQAEGRRDHQRGAEAVDVEPGVVLARAPGVVHRLRAASGTAGEAAMIRRGRGRGSASRRAGWPMPGRERVVHGGVAEGAGDADAASVGRGPSIFSTLPTMPTTAFSLISATVVAGSVRSTSPASIAAYSSSGSASTSTFRPRARAVLRVERGLDDLVHAAACRSTAARRRTCRTGRSPCPGPRCRRPPSAAAGRPAQGDRRQDTADGQHHLAHGVIPPGSLEHVGILLRGRPWPVGPQTANGGRPNSLASRARASPPRDRPKSRRATS